MEAGIEESSGWRDRVPFISKKGTFHSQSTLVATERAVATDSPVAGDDEREGVACEGVAHGAGTSPYPQVGGELSVGGHAAAGDRILRQEYAALEGRAGVESDDGEVDGVVFAAEDALQLFGKAVDRGVVMGLRRRIADERSLA